MISSEHRFHGRNSLRFVYKTGQTIHGPLFSVRYAPNPRRKSYRAAVVVSRKVNKSAVVRNRLRRQIYDCLHLLDNRIKQPIDIVITVYQEVLADQPPKITQRQLAGQLKQAGILETPPNRDASVL